MKFIIDQNSFRSPKLKDYLAASDENFVVVTDTAMFEMLKGTDPILTAKKSLAILSGFPNQVLGSAGTGELMRQELTNRKSIDSPIDQALTKGLSNLLQEVSGCVKGIRPSFPMQEADIVRDRATALSERLDHKFHKTSLDGTVGVLRKDVPEELRKDIRKGLLTKDVYKFVYQSAFIAFKNAINDYALENEDVQKLYLDYCLTARYSMVYMLSSLHWFETGGAESMPAAKVTNDFHDVDYVVLASYFDGILSEEARVNRLYQRMKNFFEANITEKNGSANDF